MNTKQGLAILLLSIFISCNETKAPIHLERAFYYWKNNEEVLTNEEQGRIKNLQVQKLYVKFFEVGPDDIFGVKPFAKSQLHIPIYTPPWSQPLNSPLLQLKIVPTVFIKNNVFHEASEGSLDSLADNVNFLIDKYYTSKMRVSSPCNEIQIDCDWTAKTKDKYFYFLKAIKKYSRKTISCTLRLYPYKYPAHAGMPPVDKATLMCYNLISPLDNPDKNSIQDASELESYLRNVEKYPLPLDIALPVFSWMHIYQNNHFVGLINGNIEPFKNVLKPIKPLWYELQRDTVINDLYLRAGDKVKLEETTEQTTQQAIALLKKHLPLRDTTTITLFHLDAENLHQYSNEALTRFYTAFAQPQ